MRLLFAFLSLSLIIGLAEASAQQNDAKGSGARLALVIGNAAYPNADPPLKEPVSDARALGEELKRDGFEVEVGENLDKGRMQVAFRRLYDKINPGSVALVFFSGYGIQSNRQSYMIPIDGQIFREDDVRHDGISLDSVLSEMNSRGASVKIAILDASRRNRFETNFRKAPIGLALPATPPGGTLIMYSAASGSVVRNATNDHSLFVSELLKEMRAPEPGEEVFNRTRMGVVRATQGEQNPSNYSSLTEDFSFGPTIKRPTTPPPVDATARRDYEDAEQIDTKKSWEDFLGKHPTGFYAELAQEKLAKVLAQEKLAKVEPEHKLPDTQPQPIQPIPLCEKDVAKDPAIKELGDRLELNPKDSVAFYKRGQLYAMKGCFSASITDFDKTISLNPKDADALNNRCFARAMVGNLQAALRDCTDALKVRPNYADALDSRGLVNLKIGQNSNAIADFDAALRINRNQASSLYGRGIAKLRTSRTAEGNSDIAAAKGINPGIADEFLKYGIR